MSCVPFEEIVIVILDVFLLSYMYRAVIKSYASARDSLYRPSLIPTFGSLGEDSIHADRPFEYTWRILRYFRGALISGD
jgi:hypothetical protein